MSRIDIKVVLFCCDGLFQRDLMWRLYDAFRLQAIVLQVEESARPNLWRRMSRYTHPVALANYVVTRSKRRFYDQKAKPVIESLFYRNGRFPTFPPDVPIIEVENINDDRTADVLEQFLPDVVCVNGTRLIRPPLLDRIPDLPLGMINLHTGLSPYSRGGNCNLFMLIERHPELVGITIHHIDRGIDHGDIIITSRPDMSPDDNFEIIDAKTFKLGNECMVTAVKQLRDGKAERVPQWIEGKLFLQRTGYLYNPFLHVEVNRTLSNGLIKDYLALKSEMDAGVRLIGAQIEKSNFTTGQ
jgi:folate-dependent phosphoribosylglycinamide formyltransferase PurN